MRRINQNNLVTHSRYDKKKRKKSSHILTKKTGSHDFIKLFFRVEVDISSTKYGFIHRKGSSKYHALSAYTCAMEEARVK